MTTQVSEGIQILDDGEYYVQLNVNFPPADAPGFLQRRCYVGVTTPDGYECVGSFERSARGGWRASIDAPYDPVTGSDCHSLGEHRSRLDAIAALWSARRQAHCRHKEE
jgi:hypothetical protein